VAGDLRQDQAARALGIEMVMVRRPALPDVLAESVGARFAGGRHL
jgi:hypothetical protein